MKNTIESKLNALLQGRARELKLMSELVMDLQAALRLLGIDEAKLAEARAAVVKERSEAGAEAAKRQIDVIGPRLWEAWHRRALAWKGGDDSAAVMDLYRKLPCGECKTNFSRHLKETPAQWDEAGFDYFAWTVEQHNKVRRLQGKPELKLEEARALYA